MTRVTFFKRGDGDYAGFTAEGHSLFAYAGDDIICAALSLLTINTVNSIDEYTPDASHMKVEADEKRGYIRCDLKGPLSSEGRVLMQAYELGVTSLSRTYGAEYVLVRTETVDRDE